MRGGGNEKFIETKSGNYLSPKEVAFVDDYISTGFARAWESYKKAFGCKETSAKTKAYKLLQREGIMLELQSRINASKASEAWIISKAIGFVETGERNIMAGLTGIKALELLAKHKGMLKEEVKNPFTADFPCIIAPFCTKEQFEELQKNNKRLIE